MKRIIIILFPIALLLSCKKEQVADKAAIQAITGLNITDIQIKTLTFTNFNVPEPGFRIDYELKNTQNLSYVYFIYADGLNPVLTRGAEITKPSWFFLFYMGIKYHWKFGYKDGSVIESQEKFYKR